MKYVDNHPTSRDFRHLHRDLEPGEQPPPLPSLAQQVAACKMPPRMPDPAPPDLQDGNDDF
ncbi:MAG TPA: hypothetical protein PK375_00270 [Rhodocyclaceae bacterium]|nr:hypothetical protein [Rhodocyclaceae bacterium]